MTQEERIRNLRILLKYAEEKHYHFEGKFSKEYDIMASSECFLCRYCAALLYSLYRIYRDSKTEESKWLLEELAYLDFSELKNEQGATPNFSKFEDLEFALEKTQDSTWTVFWGKVLNKDHSSEGINFEDVCKSLVNEVAEEFGDYYEGEESLEKWNKKQAEYRTIIRCSRKSEADIRRIIYDNLISCPVEKYPEIRCQVLRYKLANFKKLFLCNTTARGPYVLNHGGIWEGNFGAGEEPVSGQLWVDFGGFERDINCKFYPDNRSECFDWKPQSTGASNGHYITPGCIFETWLYDSGRNSLHPNLNGTAYWAVSHVSAFILEYAAVEIEELAMPLFIISVYKELIGELIEAIRNGHSKWKTCHVQWTYIKELDDIIKELKCRQMSSGFEKSHNPKKDDTNTQPQALSKEQPWVEDAPEYIPNSKAIKLSDGKPALLTLSKLLKPSGPIRYMRRGQRCKVHVGDFRDYMKTLGDDMFSIEAFEKYLA